MKKIQVVSFLLCTMSDDLCISRLDSPCSLITRNLFVKLTEFKHISFSWKVSLLPVNDGMRRIACLWSMRTWCWHMSEGLWHYLQPGSARKCSIWKKTFSKLWTEPVVINDLAHWKKPVRKWFANWSKNSFSLFKTLFIKSWVFGGVLQKDQFYVLKKNGF